jgi:hypothetical protein
MKKFIIDFQKKGIGFFQKESVLLQKDTRPSIFNEQYTTFDPIPYTLYPIPCPRACPELVEWVPIIACTNIRNKNGIVKGLQKFFENKSLFRQLLYKC